jgi:hypothetical protein
MPHRGRHHDADISPQRLAVTFVGFETGEAHGADKHPSFIDFTAVSHAYLAT